MDARIPLMYQGINIEPRSNALARAMQLQGQQQQNRLMQLQMQEYERKTQEAQRRQNALEQLTRSIPSPEIEAVRTLGGDLRPTTANAARIPAVDPRQQMMWQALQAGAVDPVEYLKQGTQGPELMTVAPGASVIDKRKPGQPLYTAPSAEPKAPSAVQEYEYAKSQGYKGSYQQWVEGKARAGATSVVTYGSPVPVMLPDGSIGYAQPPNKAGAAPQMMTGPDGKPMVKPSDQKDKDLTEAQAKATALLGQMKSATKALTDVGADQTVMSVQAETALAGGPMNIAVREKAQRIRQAQDQWSEAFLRFKTGAAATKDEIDANRKTFFPVLGDKPEQVRQKLEARAQAERDMEIVAGRGGQKLAERDAAAPPVSPASSPVRKYNPQTRRIE